MTIESESIGNISEIILHRKASVVDEIFVGMLVPSMRVIDNTNYLLLDGSTFSQEDYPELYEIIGSTTLPNMTNRTVYGSGTSGRYSTHSTVDLGASVAAVLPSHTHTATRTYANGSNTKLGASGSNQTSVQARTNTSRTVSFTGNSARTDTFAHSKLTYVYWYIVAKKENI